MQAAVKPGGPPTDSNRQERLAKWLLRLVQVLFVVIVLFELDAPFLSAHNERQNQSFDMARHVCRDGWSSVLVPKVSFVFEGYENLRYSPVRLEFPFHGVIAWPITAVTGHERAVMRLISVIFSLAAIQLLYIIMRIWLPPLPSALGTAIWAMAPLVLQFGQLPLPDVLCTAGMLASFWFAMRGKLPASSGWFLFAALAKLSVIVFGLPVLVALLIARQCKSIRDFFRLSIAWGWLPLLGIVVWMAPLAHYGPPTRMSTAQIMSRRGMAALLDPGFYRYTLGHLFPFGVGVLGFVGLVFAFVRSGPKMDRMLKWAIIISNAVFLGYVFREIPEPQYILPVLVWFAIGAAFGFTYLGGKLRAGLAWRTALGATALLHVLGALACTVDLKSSRIPDIADIESAAKLLPPDARVITLYRYYGAGPAVWLDRNVVAIGTMPGLEGCSRLRSAGFEYLIILDIEAWHDRKSDDGPLAWISRVFQAVRKKPPTNSANLASYSNPEGPYRQYCDRHFTPLFTAPHVVLYSLAAPPKIKGQN